MIEYFMLLDHKKYGTLVKADGRIQYEYIHGSGWVRSGILLEYQIPESPLYDAYKEITENEVLEIIRIEN